MSEVLNHISLMLFKKAFKPEDVTSIGDDFFVADVRYAKNQTPFLEFPTRVDGFLGLFCVSGNLSLSVDLGEFAFRRNSFAVIVPGNIARLKNVDRKEGCHLVAICLSTSYFMKLKFDMGRFFSDTMSPSLYPCIVLNRTEIALAMRYYSLMKEVLSSGRPYFRESISMLCTSLVYEVAGSWAGRIREVDRTNDSSGRPKELYDRFIKLVAEHHMENRNVQFYADELFISPKYLAKVVKSVSGRTASYWIDSYVILEAKNLLKYSNDTIKQIVFKLNFSNQSVFYKFFKSHTGLTPSEYRNA